MSPRPTLARSSMKRGFWLRLIDTTMPDGAGGAAKLLTLASTNTSELTLFVGSAGVHGGVSLLWFA